MTNNPPAQFPQGNATVRGAHAARYILIGFFTVAPLWVTWLVFDFLLGILAGAGTLVQTVYGGTKRFLASLRQPPVSGQRVVLIRFPSPEMKAVGFLTRVMQDADTGRELAAVYVPTSPNPTSGYIEIVPLDEVVHTDWTMVEAMSFVMTGGTNAPERVRYTRPAEGREGEAP